MTRVRSRCVAAGHVEPRAGSGSGSDCQKEVAARRDVVAIAESAHEIVSPLPAPVIRKHGLKRRSRIHPVTSAAIVTSTGGSPHWLASSDAAGGHVSVMLAILTLR